MLQDFASSFSVRNRGGGSKRGLQGIGGDAPAAAPAPAPAAEKKAKK